MFDYWLLFSSGFISSTLLPGGSELLFIYYLQQPHIDIYWALFAVTIGNSLGSVVTFLMGYYFHYGQQQTAQKYPAVLDFCQRWGHFSLLLAWMPVIGELICLLAGWLRLPQKRAFTLIFIGKLLRYLVLMILLLMIH